MADTAPKYTNEEMRQAFEELRQFAQAPGAPAWAACALISWWRAEQAASQLAKPPNA